MILANKILQSTFVQGIIELITDSKATLLVIEAVLAQDYICVVGNSDKIEEGKELFGEVKDLLV